MSPERQPTRTAGFTTVAASPLQRVFGYNIQCPRSLTSDLTHSTQRPRPGDLDPDFQRQP
jgi:hypothetical protein